MNEFNKKKEKTFPASMGLCIAFNLSHHENVRPQIFQVHDFVSLHHIPLSENKTP